MMSHSCLAAGVALVAAGFAFSPVAHAGPAPSLEDRAVLESCLKAAADNRARCINRLYDRCVAAPEGSSTVGMEDCAARELAVWDEKLNAAYRKLVAGDLGRIDALPENRPAENPRAKAVKGAVLLADMEKAWLAWRTRKCDASALTAEGGTLARVIYGSCYLDETARQALFLQGIIDDLAGR